MPGKIHRILKINRILTVVLTVSGTRKGNKMKQRPNRKVTERFTHDQPTDYYSLSKKKLDMRINFC